MIKEAVVTPEQVIEAYRETGLMPTEDIPYEVVDGKAYGCAIGALYLKEYGEPSKDDSFIPYLKYADKLFSGNSLAFGAGFDTGYEGIPFEKYLPDYGEDEADEIRKLGYECGRKVKEELCSSK